MAKFDISYVIKAIDRFSPIANKIAKSAKEMQQSIRGASAGTKKIGDVLNKTVKEGKAYNKTFNLDPAVKKIAKTNHGLTAMVNNSDRVGSSMRSVTGQIMEQHKRFAHFADFFAMSAFFRLMNVGWPIMGIAIPALQELSQVENASVALKGMVGNFDEINAQANTFVKTTTFSKAEIMKAAQSLAGMRLSGDRINTVLKGAADYAAATGMSLDQAVGHIAQAAIARKGVGTTGVMALGGTAASRAVRDAQMLSKKFGGIAQAQARTVTGQLKQTFNLLNESVGEILQESAGPLLTIFRYVVKIVGAVGHWVKENKALANVLGYAIAGMAAFLAVGVVLGTVIGLASFAFSAFAFVIRGAGIALGLFKAVAWAVSSSMIILRNVMIMFNVATVLVTGGLRLLRGVMAAVNIVLFANPIGIVIALIAGLAAGVYFAVTNWKKFKCAMFAVYEFMKKVFIVTINAVKDTILSMVSPLQDAYNWFAKLIGIKDKATKGNIEQQVKIATNMSSPGYMKEMAKTPANDMTAANRGYQFGYMPSLTMPAMESPEMNIGGGETAHNVTIKVEGTNAQVKETAVIESGQLQNTTLSVGTNYSGGGFE